MICEQASFLSPVDMMIVMAVALVVFGPAKLPEVGRQLGQAIRELKKLTGELTESIHNETVDIKSAFDTVSPYALKPGPIDQQPKLPEPVQGYSNREAMSESPLVTKPANEQPGEAPAPRADSDASAEQTTTATPVQIASPKSGEENL